MPAFRIEVFELFAERMTDVMEVAAPHVVLAEGAPAMGGMAAQIPIKDDPAANEAAISAPPTKTAPSRWAARA